MHWFDGETGSGVRSGSSEIEGDEIEAWGADDFGTLWEGPRSSDRDLQEEQEEGINYFFTIIMLFKLGIKH